MSIQDQVEAAWKKYRPEALSTNSMALSHDVFTAGYLAGLRSLYRDMSVGEMKLLRVEYDGEIENVWFLHDGVWGPAFCLSHDSYFMWKPDHPGLGLRWRKEFFLSESISRIVKMLPIPSPSDLFTEGRA